MTWTSESLYTNKNVYIEIDHVYLQEDDFSEYLPHLCGEITKKKKQTKKTK